MQLVLRRSCCKLETAVYAIGIILTTLYLVVGLGGVVWFVLCHMEDSDVMTKLKELYLLKVIILLFKRLIIECKSHLVRTDKYFVSFSTCNPNTFLIG